MYTMRYQKGMTGIGWILTLVLIAFFALIAMKIVPIYMTSFTVSSILSDVEQEPDMGSKTPGEILQTIGKRFRVNMVKDVSRDNIYIDSTKNEIIVEIEYEVRRNFIGNVDLVLSFNKQANIPKQ